MAAKMGDLKMQDILRCYDGTGDVVAWLEKIKLVAELRKTKDLSLVIPLFLGKTGL